MPEVDFRVLLTLLFEPQFEPLSHHLTWKQKNRQSRRQLSKLSNCHFAAVSQIAISDAALLMNPPKRCPQLLVRVQLVLPVPRALPARRVRMLMIRHSPLPVEQSVHQSRLVVPKRIDHSLHDNSMDIPPDHTR
jgi:hypothetical protein